MKINFLLAAALVGLTGVLLGAFGAHGLRESLSPAMLTIYKTAVDYQMWHALALMGVALLLRYNPDEKSLIRAGWCFLFGVVSFSGSLYLLACLNMKWLGMVTPIGGVSFLGGWGLLALFSLKDKSIVSGHNETNESD
ncbi:MAG TPA: DUF423 domain-containing protein [Methylococcaceae bacterium]|nr:DUF423 domain-containing protein [Methylococcaceae bacterium]HIN68772.1 DUF423 domain-containing protein [Methylococcales bacterium]HIA44678.1 DUF423 domain-containing protein [Methylococcaceae bacterium]HIB62462.1 DUF423 domain-containing protein [Methylococcaceae bacterium]HIO12816.1 DUF423 domain-containing protein [Methylococcales bacterium]